MSELNKIDLSLGPLGSRKPKPFQTGGVFRCFCYVPFLGWVPKNLLLLFVLIVGAAAAVIVPSLAPRREVIHNVR